MPAVTSYTPTEGTRGTTVTFTGEDLAAVDTVMFDNRTAQLVEVSDTHVVAVIPANVRPGPIAVILYGPTGGFYAPPGFTYIDEANPPDPEPGGDPVISVMRPTRGMASLFVAFYGANLADTVTVSFGVGVEVEVTAPTDTYFQVQIPRGAPVGPVNVEALVAGRWIPAGEFTITTLLDPEITGVTPRTGWTGQVVTFTGAGLSFVDRINFADLGVDTFERTDTSVKGFLPGTPGQTGTVTMQALTTLDGQTYPVPGEFEYIKQPPPPPIPGDNRELEPGEDACQRAAWLTLPDGRVIDLEDVDAGYFCAELDLGYPEVRDVSTNRPDANGTDDFTRLWGARVVTAKIVAIAGAGTRHIDDIARRFGPYLVPSVRPTLHYRLHTPEDDYAERTIVLRASDWSAPIIGDRTRELHLAWVAPDPVIRAATRSSITVWAGSSAGVSGRSYPLIFDRNYPGSGGGAPIDRPMIVTGDFPVAPLLRIFGPVDSPTVTIVRDELGGPLQVRLAPGVRIDAGMYYEIDMAARSVTRVDRGLRTNGLRDLEWMGTLFGAVPVGDSALVTMRGQNTDHTTQTVVEWSEGYVS